MNALTIVLIVLALLLALSLARIQLTVQYKNKLKLIVKVLFFRKTIVKKFTDTQEKPSPKKKPDKKKKPKKDNKPKDASKAEQPSFARRLFDQQGIGGLIEVIKQLLILIKGTLRYFFKHFIVSKLIIRVKVAGDDAGTAALNYGRVSAVVYPLAGHLAYALGCENYTVDVLCNFDENAESDAYLYMYGSVRIVYLIILAAKAAARAGKTYLKLKFRK